MAQDPVVAITGPKIVPSTVAGKSIQGMAGIGRTLASDNGKQMSLMGLKKVAEPKDFDLTRLELIGLTLAANGYRAAEIAARLGVSEREIETLLFCAERKLGGKNRLHAISIAVQSGLIGIEV